MILKCTCSQWSDKTEEMCSCLRVPVKSRALWTLCSRALEEPLTPDEVFSNPARRWQRHWLLSQSVFYDWWDLFWLSQMIKNFRYHDINLGSTWDQFRNLLEVIVCCNIRSSTKWVETVLNIHQNMFRIHWGNKKYTLYQPACSVCLDPPLLQSQLSVRTSLVSPCQTQAGPLFSGTEDDPDPPHRHWTKQLKCKHEK